MSSFTVPFPVDHSLEALPKSSRIRELYPEDLYPNGNYVQLPYGRTRYWLLGPESGIRLVLIHGLSTPSITWTHIAPYLAARGFRVLVYDLYGKGYSEAPKMPYFTSLFVTQLALLLQAIRWDSAHIAGFSMGGGITAAFAATLPHLVSGKIILMASAGVHERHSPSAAEYAEETPQVIPIPQHQELIELQHHALPGYTAGVRSCMTEGPIHELLWAFDKLPTTRTMSRGALNVLIIHGTNDQLVRYADALEIKKRIPAAELVSIEGAGHDMTVLDGHWQQVAESIDSFLKKW